MSTFRSDNYKKDTRIVIAQIPDPIISLEGCKTVEFETRTTIQAAKFVRRTSHFYSKAT